MASRVLIMLVSLFLASGCAEIKALLDSGLPPRAPARPAPSPATTRPAPSPATTRPAPSPATTRPAPSPATTHPAPSPALPEAPAPLLSPQVDADREMRLTAEVNTSILGVERTLSSIDRQKLKVDQSETYQTIQSFLTQAREAVVRKDLQQAVNLAQKARVLSDELSKAVP
jgi:hypothetical protein